jgi:hypothetical protein
MKRMMAAALAAITMGSFACGSESSTFGDPSDPNTGGTAGNGVPGGSSGLGEIGPKGTSSACVNQVVSAELTPTNLVFMYDKSGSMGDNVNSNFDPKLKWDPVNDGMTGFFGDPYSSTVRASLQFFPIDDSDIPSACGAPYATPQVALTMANDPSFVSTLGATKPEGGTPTLPALQGAIAYAQQVAASRPTDKTAIVLVTDGEPGFYDPSSSSFVPGCPNNDIAHVAAAAQAAFAAAPSIPTYVIGVGPSLDKLNTIASAGGTSAAMMVDVSDPSTTKSQIEGALGKIRTATVSCDFSIPPAPAGETLDPFAVNVVLTANDGSQKVLGYSKTCSDPAGWQYDNPGTPTRITLCSNACDQARASAQGKVSLAFGCKTQVSIQ